MATKRVSSGLSQEAIVRGLQARAKSFDQRDAKLIVASLAHFLASSASVGHAVYLTGFGDGHKAMDIRLSAANVKRLSAHKG